MMHAHQLRDAFASFTAAAETLQRSYAHLEGEVVHLRQELACSRDENRCVRESQQAILQSLPCGVLVASWPTGEVHAANPAALIMFGMEGQTLTNLKQLRAEFVVFLLLQTAEKSEEWELEVVEDQAGSRCLSGRQVVLQSKRAEEHRSVFILEDTTERNRLLREREGFERQRALATMAAVLAHEVRNPLCGMELYAELLADSPLDPEQLLFVEHLRAGLRLLGATVNNVLHFHSAPLRNLMLLNVDEFLAAVCSFLRPLAHQSRVEISVDAQVEGTVLPADRHCLEQVLLNLAINSIRHMPHGGRLSISARVAGCAPATLRIEVADEGPGIPEEDRERIFDPGYSTISGSAGLGLTVCRAIVQQHGGTIAAHNRPEGGAVFAVQLPLGERNESCACSG
jgi:signal transduction histidine kinase